MCSKFYAVPNFKIISEITLALWEYVAFSTMYFNRDRIYLIY